jgi:LmbE family N-acetylglucosaminyl deacetylase
LLLSTRGLEVSVILAVLAHPDDESFGMGGTLALYASRGVDVYLLCATGGEVGTVDPKFLQAYRTVAELRESELRCAAARLGLKGVFFLGYRDSGMPGTSHNSHPDAHIAHPVEEVATSIVRHLRKLRPDAVLTFDPYGVYGHPDHIHVHRATVMACERSGDPTFDPESGTPYQVRALYFHFVRRGLLKLAIRIMPFIGQDPRKSGHNHNIDLTSMVANDYPTHVRVDIRSAQRAKEAASACHASQGGGTALRGLRAVFGERELFMRSFPPVPAGWRVKKDLLDLA